MDPVIQQLISTGWKSPSSEEVVPLPVQVIQVEAGLAAYAADLVGNLKLGRRFAVVSDPITHEVLGETIEKSLQGVASVVSVIMPGKPVADSETALRLGQAIRSVDAVIAVGSGTINDLCKYASFREGKPYVIFGTAPSMNGYCSANASLTVGGHKKTLAAQLPYAVFMDSTICSKAPARLISSGLGDSLCRSTCQADWMLSHFLRGTVYDDYPFSLLKPYEEALYRDAEALLKGNGEAVERLIAVLIISGLSMVGCKGSYPASQGEHLIAHAMEMQRGRGSVSNFHGEQIAVTTLAMARLQHAMLEDPPVIAEKPVPTKGIQTYFGEQAGQECLEELRKKGVSAEQRERLNQSIKEHWPEWSLQLSKVMVEEEKLRKVLCAGGAPISYRQLGWEKESYRNAIRFAYSVRDRYTFLDLAVETGRLEAELVNPGIL